MRAKDYIESNCKYQFYNELKKAINVLSIFRNDKSATENYYELNLVQDRVRKRYFEDLNDWKLNNLDESSKPVYIENDLGISHQEAFNFRNHLYKAIEADKSFGYLFYLLASEKNRSEIFYQKNPIECIPDKKIIEETIYNYQDDYPKKSLEAYLTYCDFNYSFFKKHNGNNKDDKWLGYFNDGYFLFDILRTKILTPFQACEIIIQRFEDSKNGIAIIVPLVIELLENYNYDLTVEQNRCKRILVDEIQNYYDSYLKDFFAELQSTENETPVVNETVIDSEIKSENDNYILPENYIQNGGIITTGSYELDEYYRYFITKNTNKELFLVDKLEISLAHYASNYKKNCDDYWETYQFDPNFFNDFIPGDFLSEFNMALHDFIKPLNNQEINRYLSTSINQFKTHTPDKRKDIFCVIYHDVYWYPNYMEYTGSSARDNYVLHVWNQFSKHFYLFQEATQSAYDIFKASLINGSANNIGNSYSVDNTHNKNKSELLKSDLFENGFFEITKVKSLTHDGQSKLIDLLELNDTPYIIAMFDFLGYFKYLTNEHGLTNSKIHSKVGSWLNTNTQTIKCNMLVLNEKSALRENNRYTAHLHKEKVKTDYYSLK